ncbi:MAG: GNAT family N-acetyltransferase [Pyrinomonadaceae bacterium]
MQVEPVVLRGKFVSLEPLEADHLSQLCEVGLESDLWKWTIANVGNEEAMAAYIASALADQLNGGSLPFVTRDIASDRIIGSTRFGNIDRANRKAEIGWTWVAPKWQRTYVNTEAKLLMLTHAFDGWHCIRVEFKTDSMNMRSRDAITRLGAKEEGILRNHMITESGRFRDSIYFSIIESEWNAIKTNLLEKLAKSS